MPNRRKLANKIDFQPRLFDDLDFVDESARPVHPVIHRAVTEIEREAALRRQAEEILSSKSPLRFFSFGSGSSGNSAFIGDDHSGLLIDAGVDPVTVEDGLRANGIKPESVSGIILTHDHSDHIRYVYAITRRFKHMLIYCTPRVLGGMLRRHSISRRVKDYHHPIYKEFMFRPCVSLEVTPFEVSHDGSDNIGFFLRHIPSGTTVAVATDLGCITDRVDHYMRQADNIMIEANYDATMLATGRYPAYLKARIAAPNGHLDNRVTASFLAGIMSERLRNIFLCHLSQDNNRPDIAVATVRDALIEAGAEGVGDGSASVDTRHLRLQLAALPRHDLSPTYILSV